MSFLLQGAIRSYAIKGIYPFIEIIISWNTVF